MTRQLALELAPEIRVNCVVPSLADTNLSRGGVWNPSRRGCPTGWRARIPLGRLCQPEDVAAAMAYLASDRRSCA